MRIVFIFCILWSSFALSVPATVAAETAFVSIYSPILKSMGLDLKIETYEESDDYYGGASLEGVVFRISMGKNIRSDRNGMLAFGLCHEVGHLLGGEPKKTTSTWASTEAQSDFYATSVCLKKLYRKHPELIKMNMKITTEVVKACQDAFSNRLERRICEYSSQNAFIFFTDVWAYISFAGIQKPSFRVHTPATVEKNRNYPSLQCRLEIGFSGALCRDQSCVKPACF